MELKPYGAKPDFHQEILLVMRGLDPEDFLYVRQVDTTKHMFTNLETGERITIDERFYLGTEINS